MSGLVFILVAIRLEYAVDGTHGTNPMRDEDDLVATLRVADVLGAIACVPLFPRSVPWIGRQAHVDDVDQGRDSATGASELLGLVPCGNMSVFMIEGHYAR